MNDFDDFEAIFAEDMIRDEFEDLGLGEVYGDDLFA